jgi:hypothetical protein
VIITGIHPFPKEVAMNGHTFRIVETEDGEFVLNRHTQSQNLDIEMYRSRDIDEVVEKIKQERGYRTHHDGGFNNFPPLLESVNSLTNKYPCHDKKDFPSGWTDPLDLYGCLVQELFSLEIEIEVERKKIVALVFSKGAEWVWKNRILLVAEQVYTRSADGMVQGEMGG